MPHVRIFGILIPTYGICILLGLVFGAAFGLVACRRDGVLKEDFAIVSCAVGLAGIIGAKLFWCGTISDSLASFARNAILCLYRPEYQRGGFVFYGFLIMGVPGFLFGLKLSRLPARLADALTAAFCALLPLVHAFGRIGCFFAGCCHGKEFSGLFSVRYPAGALNGLPADKSFFPVQLVEAAGLFAIFAIIVLLRRRWGFSSRRLFWVYLALYGILRFFDEFLRGDSERGMLGVLSVSQVVSVLAMAFAVVSGFVSRCRSSD